MPKTLYLASQVLESTLRGASFTTPAAIYMALYTTSPSISGGGVEVSGGNYLREAVTFAPSASGQAVSAADVIFPIASTDWGTIVAYGLFDALSAGNLLYFSVLSSPRAVLTNDQVKFPAGQLAVVES